MNTIKTENKLEHIIKKSKFICLCIPVTCVEDVDKNLSKIRKEYSDATHVVYAYTLFSPSVEKASDDGEPSGTAGKPVLDCIKRLGLVNILVVVVRYFGGIKLGAGGLTRAYANVAKDTISTMQICQLSYYLAINLSIKLDNAYYIANNPDIEIVSTDYHDIASKIVKYNLLVKENEETLAKLENLAKDMEIVDRKLM